MRSPDTGSVAISTLSKSVACRLKAMKTARIKISMWRRWLPSHLEWQAVYGPFKGFYESMLDDPGALKHLNKWRTKYSGGSHTSESGFACGNRIIKLDRLIKIARDRDPDDVKKALERAYDTSREFTCITSKELSDRNYAARKEIKT